MSLPSPTTRRSRASICRTPRPRVTAAVAVLISLLLTACTTPQSPTPHPSPPPSGTATAPATPQRVTVFAAASLTEAFTEISALDPRLEITYSFDGSPTLVDQILAGAPVDVLATADEATMRRAVNAGVTAGEPTIFARNTAVMIVPTGNPAGVTGLDGSLAGKKLVICAPAVPCGATAHRIADAIGYHLTPVSEEQKVTDVRGKVASGEADAGIVFATDAAAAADQVDVIELPGAAEAGTRYPVAVLNDAGNTEAAGAFLALVTGEQGRAVLARHGFTTP